MSMELPEKYKQICDWLSEQMDAEDIAFLEKNKLQLSDYVEKYLKSFAKKSHKLGVLFLVTVNLIVIWFFRDGAFGTSLYAIIGILLLADFFSLSVLKTQNQREFSEERLVVKKDKPSLTQHYLLFYISKDIQIARGVWTGRSK